MKITQQQFQDFIERGLIRAEDARATPKRKRKTRNRNTGPHANLEPAAGDAPHEAEKSPRFTAPVRVTFYHTRRTLADQDNLSGKAVLDGIVTDGVLADDSPKEVTEVRHIQTQGPVETTTIIIELV